MYKNTNGKIFGNNVKRLRLERKLTLAQLSRLSKISNIPYKNRKWRNKNFETIPSLTSYAGPLM